MASSYLNQAISTNDGSTGITPVGSDGQVVREVADRSGRAWVRMFYSAGEVSNTNPFPVTVVSSALPLGAATASNQTTSNSSLASIVTNTTGLATQTTLSAVSSNTSSTATVQGAIGDPAVATDTTGTLSGKMRGMVKLLSEGTTVIGNVASDGVDSGNPVKTGYFATAVTNLSGINVADGDRVNAVGSNQGELYAYLSRQIAGEDLTNNILFTAPNINALQSTNKFAYAYASSTTAQTLNAKSGAGNLFLYRGTNLSSGNLYLGIVNKSTAAANGDAFYMPPVPVGAGQVVGDEFMVVGLSMGTGIQLCWSSTANTVTLSNGGQMVALYK